MMMLRSGVRVSKFNKLYGIFDSRHQIVRRTIPGVFQVEEEARSYASFGSDIDDYDGGRQGRGPSSDGSSRRQEQRPAAGLYDDDSTYQPRRQQHTRFNPNQQPPPRQEGFSGKGSRDIDYSDDGSRRQSGGIGNIFPLGEDEGSTRNGNFLPSRHHQQPLHYSNANDSFRENVKHGLDQGDGKNSHRSNERGASSVREPPPPPPPPDTVDIFKKMKRTGLPHSNEDDNFLEKFKLGFDQGDEKNPLRSNEPGTASVREPPQPPPPPQDADEIFKKMKETGLIPNAVAMLHGLCSDGLVEEAMKLFGLMRAKGTIPEVVIYTAVVEGFCKAQKLDDAKRIFRKMQNNGISPNAFSYSVLIQGLYNDNSLDDALEFCVEMLETGHSPNLATFTGLVDRFCRERGLEAAEAMIGTLMRKGYLVDVKAVKEFLEKRGPFLPLVWEAIFGKKKTSKGPI